ncbi:cytochrome c oxidase subunit 3 [Caulobacter mirabilis]|uniref:Probable cytochrome c oxidase subunit 3 n=1 Tax=Caulobacter mirabilis TaxID=69666 RepID=A0A2D2B1W3_9CAUL|nr:cytochrome c oxidase subunit 3 [Caulobacter mirabilis]ATQ44233.1 cytochrome c oxidase subunit 3 [Caulobacter mirabilis]
MAHGAVKHDYHLVNPSPWPFVGSVAATIMMIGAVSWMKGIIPLNEKDGVDLWELLFSKGHPWLFLAGLAGILYTMFGWWSDVIKEANAGDHTPIVSLHLRYGMIMFIASEVMFFVAWFWIFFEMALFQEHRTLTPAIGNFEGVAEAWKQWPPKGIELVPAFHLPLVNTLTLLLSGTTVTWAHHALQQGDRKGAKLALALTIVLGVLFTCIQVYEYQHILHEKLFYSEEAVNSGLYGSSFFMATGFHGFHVLIGTIFLAVCFIRLLNGAFTPKQHFGFEAAAWYWHFVDVVWLFLFAFIYVIFGTP